MRLTMYHSSMLIAIVPISALQLFSCSQTDSVAQKDAQVTRTGSRSVNYDFTISQHYPNCWFGAIVGEIEYIDEKTNTNRVLIPSCRDYRLNPTRVCNAYHVTNLDSLTKEACTEYVTMQNGAHLQLFFGTFLAHGGDTCSGWYNFTDTVGIYIDVVESIRGQIVQTLDSCIMLPFNHTSNIVQSSLHRNVDIAITNPEKYPLKSRYLLRLPADSLRVKIQVRMTFGATDPAHRPNVKCEIDQHGYRTSESAQEIYNDSRDELSEVKERLRLLVDKLDDDFDIGFAKILKIHKYKQYIDEEFQFSFSSSQGREYALRVVNEQGETLHDFGKSYAFPGMEQTFRLDTATMPKGLCVVTISTGGKVCYLVPFIVRHDGKKLTPRVPMTGK